MVSCEADAERGGEAGERRVFLVRPELPWAGQCRFERVLVAQAGPAAVLGDLLQVSDLDDLVVEPDRLAQRYCRARGS